MPTCPQCHEDRPFRSFESGAQLFAICQPCRRREADRLRKRRQTAGKGAHDQAKARAHTLKLLKLEKARKRLRTAFLRLTAVTRHRIAAMERKVDPTEKTLKALAARKDILRRYERALLQQFDMLDLGLPPGDIQDMVEL